MENNEDMTGIGWFFFAEASIAVCFKEILLVHPGGLRLEVLFFTKPHESKPRLFTTLIENQQRYCQIAMYRQQCLDFRTCKLDKSLFVSNRY